MVAMRGRLRDFWRRPNGNVASERQTAAINSRRVVFIVQLEAGISTCNHLLQVWASFGAPAMGSQSSAVRDELFDLHIVQEQEMPGASPALRLYLSATSSQGDLLHLVHCETHIQRYRHATWRCLPVDDRCSWSHESCDLFVSLAACHLTEIELRYSARSIWSVISKSFPLALNTAVRLKNKYDNIIY